MTDKFCKGINRVQLHNVPEDLKSHKQWVAWKAVQKENGKLTKIPVNPHTGMYASTNNAETWGSFEEASNYYSQNNDDGIAGIGFVFTKNDPFCGVDLDECRDPNTGEFNDWAVDYLNQIDSYSEISPSMTGVKVFSKGALPGRGRNFGNVEMYDRERFFTVTGEVFNGYPRSVKNRSDEVVQLYRKLDNHGQKIEPPVVEVPGNPEEIDIDRFPINYGTKKLIREGEAVGKRSEAIMSVVDSLVKAGASESEIFNVFEYYPIGEKYREKGSLREHWLKRQIEKARDFTNTNGSDDSKGVSQQPHEPMSSGDEHDEIIKELNKKHAVVLLGGKFAIMNEGTDPVFMRPEITFSSSSDFNNLYMNRIVRNPKDTGPRDISISKLWLESPDRREYKRIVFNPQNDVEGCYNLYRGLALKPKEGDWSLYKKHMQEVIANGNKEAYQYLIHWMAQLVQKPGGERPGTAIVLRGKQGTGKGCFVSQFGKIFGSHFLQINNQRQLTGQFNNHLKDALLVFVDEGIWAGDKSAEGVLKGMITEDQIIVEPKGKDAFAVKNHLRLIVASNNDWVIPAGLEERRFFVLDVSDRYMQNQEFFKPLFQQMENGGREAMLHDLLRVDLNGVDLRSFPKTDALMDQIISSMAPVGKFWFERLQEGSILTDHDKWENAIPSRLLYNEYIEFTNQMGIKFRLAQGPFGKKLRELCPQLDRKKKVCMEFPYDGKRTWYLMFPSLERCRKKFEKMVGREIDWTSDE